ncbi:MAG: signal peptidase II [Carnobacterium sp.]|uniref:Lipoprotein signal peptidase n=1 Tax=Carnobacterium antarcticum TaxID=2126436 RepID=A0ABW4NQ80_9LACT|nr:MULTISPECIES: signal peptidase II [unclassified Carnobacterium]ALV21225.1 Lipoprotein signal peptidase [Carnobacterium sp. CP1]QQP69252.1 signal peptidase II [Carnobacterium sp. CS13]
MFLYYVLAAVIIGVDQWTKYLTVAHIDLYEVVEVIPGVLSWMYIRNTGAAWSILEGKMWFFYLVTIVVVGVVVVYLQKYGKNSRLLSIALAFILAGSIGNFIDRLRVEYVIDMVRLEFINFPIFNVADMALSIGVVLMILYVFLDEKKQKKNSPG